MKAFRSAVLKVVSNTHFNVEYKNVNAGLKFIKIVSLSDGRALQQRFWVKRSRLMTTSLNLLKKYKKYIKMSLKNSPYKDNSLDNGLSILA